MTEALCTILLKEMWGGPWFQFATPCWFVGFAAGWLLLGGGPPSNSGHLGCLPCQSQSKLMSTCSDLGSGSTSREEDGLKARTGPNSGPACLVFSPAQSLANARVQRGVPLGGQCPQSTLGCV